MSPQDHNNNLTETLPEAAIEEKSGISLVWVIPIIAALIGGWLVYKALSEQGPTITITFPTAEGIEAGKTKIRFKEVEIGQVTDVDINEDLLSVIVTAELHPETRGHLTDKSRFWVVRARVAAGKVSGLGTLFSGAYIAMDPRDDGKPIKHFTGLQEPPAVTSYDHGRRFTLRADRLGSLDTGAPVYYHQVKIGEVSDHRLAEGGTSVTVGVFIRDPYSQFVRQNSRFWNASGLDFKLSAEGLEVNTESLVSVVLGGVAFDTPEPAAGPAGESQVYRLYGSKAEADAPSYTEKKHYLLVFRDSVSGLAVGSPVEAMGIKIGEVKDIRLEGNVETLEIRIRVVIETEPERFSLTGEPKTSVEDDVKDLVRRGLRAQLETGSLLTGQKYVSLGFHPEAPPAEAGREGPYLVIPTIPPQLGELKTNITELLKKLSRLPIEKIGDDLSGTLAGMNQTVNSRELKTAITDLSTALRETRRLTQSLRAESLPSLNKTLAEAERTAISARRMLSSDSPLYTEIVRTLRQLSEAARSIRVMADYLERHPEALLSGKRGRR